MSPLLSVLVAIIWPSLVTGSLLYPASTVFQLISSISLPVSDLSPNRKIFFDWGLQMNYNMPFNLSSFYMVPIWASGSKSVAKREISGGDFTRAEFYEALEGSLQRYGFHRTCWKRSICELAHHPFDESDPNFITDLLTFLMTPSLIQTFPFEESEGERNEYKLAEDQGFAGQPCHQLYSECDDDLLSILTVIN